MTDLQDSYKFSLITPLGVIENSEIVSAILPGENGEFGILKDHITLFANLKMGELKIKRADGTEGVYSLTRGNVRFRKNQLTVLVEMANKIR